MPSIERKFYILTEAFAKFCFRLLSRILHCHYVTYCLCNFNTLSSGDIYSSIKWVIISSGNGLSLIRHEAIAWINAIILSTSQKQTQVKSKYTKSRSRKYIWHVVCQLSAILYRSQFVYPELGYSKNCDTKQNLICQFSYIQFLHFQHIHYFESHLYEMTNYAQYPSK